MLTQHGDRRIARMNAPWDAPEPNFETLAGEYEGQRFNSPNDVAPRSNMASEGELFERDFLWESLADVVATYASKPLASSPGTRFIYSSRGFDMLGRVIEVVSGTSYEAFMEERVFGPLGMEDSGFFVPPELEPVVFDPIEGRYCMGEKSVGSRNTDTTPFRIRPSTWESRLTCCHSGSLPKAAQLAVAASRLSWAMM